MKIQLVETYDVQDDVTRYVIERTSWVGSFYATMNFSNLDEARAVFERLKKHKGESLIRRILESFVVS